MQNSYCVQCKQALSVITSYNNPSPKEIKGFLFNLNLSTQQFKCLSIVSRTSDLRVFSKAAQKYAVSIPISSIIMLL